MCEAIIEDMYLYGTCSKKEWRSDKRKWDARRSAFSILRQVKGMKKLSRWKSVVELSLKYTPVFIMNFESWKREERQTVYWIMQRQVNSLMRSNWHRSTDDSREKWRSRWFVFTVRRNEEERDWRVACTWCSGENDNERKLANINNIQAFKMCV